MTIRQALSCAALLVVLVAPRSLHAQSVWELSPYRISVLVADGRPHSSARNAAAEIARQVTEQTIANVGAPWDLSAAPAPPDLRTRILSMTGQVPLEELPAELHDRDKVIFVAIVNTRYGNRIMARELDVKTELWGPPVTHENSQSPLVGGEVFRAILESFRPLARIEAVDKKAVTLRLRAAALSPRDASLRWVTEGTLFRTIVRVQDRHGNTRSIRPVEWTFLHVDSISGSEAQCTMHTGLRSALTGRRRGRVELLAVAIRPPGGSTTLHLRSRSEPTTRLAAYEVFDRGPGSEAPEFLGITDRNGSLMVNSGATPLRVLWIKSGNVPLARLPLLPGWESEVEIPLPDYTPRVLAQAFISGFQQELVDLLTRREVSMARTRAQIREGKIAEAESQMRDLRDLADPAEMRVLLRQQRSRFVSNEEVVSRKIDELFSQTEGLVNQYLDPSSLEALENELLIARQQARAAD